MTASPESDDKPERQHILRTPAAFGKKIKSFEEASGVVAVKGGYFGTIADKKDKILAAKYASGELKKPGVSRGKISKVSLLIIVLVVSLAGTIAYAQWSGQWTAQTQIRAPINVLMQQFTLPDVWVNQTSSAIVDNAFIVNTAGRSITFSFQVYAATTINGTQTQDMTPLFSQFSIAFNDYTRNVTVASLLSPTQTVSFIYQSSVDQPFRLIISYNSKPVQLGANSTPLTIFFIYAYSE